MRFSIPANFICNLLDRNPEIIYTRGEHYFRFIAAESLSAADLDQIAMGWQRPLLTADFTRGMKNRALMRQYIPTPVAP